MRIDVSSLLLRGLQPVRISAVGLADVPTELLLEIGKCVASADPHHRSLSLLSQTCRRFYALFKPRIISHVLDCVFNRCITTITKSNGLEYPSNGRIVSRDLLKRRLKSIYIPCKVVYESDDIRCYRSLIFYARHIGSVTVDLRDGNLSPKALAGLLNSCIQRPCMELNVTEPNISGSRRPYPDRPFAFMLDPSRNAVQQQAIQQDRKGWFKSNIMDNIKHLLSRGRGTSPSDRTSFDPTPHILFVPRRHPTSPGPRSPPQLTALRITGDVLFTAIMYPWTNHILNSAPLTRLSITRVRLSTFEWSQILASISIPSLTQLALGSISVSFRDLLAFLARHPRLKTLDLSNNTLLGPAFFPATLPKSTFLPDLSLMIAPSSYIQIFSKQHRRGYCSKLTTFRHVRN